MLILKPESIPYTPSKNFNEGDNHDKNYRPYTITIDRKRCDIEYPCNSQKQIEQSNKYIKLFPFREK